MFKLSYSIFFIGLLTFFGLLFVSKEAQAACLNVPLSGSYTIDTSCTFDGTVNGVENGNLTIPTGKTFTINANQTIVWNPGRSVFIQGSIAINQAGGQLRKTYLWYIDTESDGYPDTVSQVAAAAAPSNGVRRSDSVFTEKWTYVLINCGPGYYNPTDACAEAGLGYYSHDENPKRYECGGNNYYCPTATSSASTAVSTGYYSTGGTETTRTGQSICEAGNYCSAGVKTACSAGTYQSSTGQTSCISASAGYYVSTTGATSQTCCAANTYTASTGQTSCTSCATCKTSGTCATSCSNAANNTACGTCQFCQSGSCVYQYYDSRNTPTTTETVQIG
ncbi:MAG: hypothetical protein COS76_01500, partial [Candidatus Portnoybacteria bacterium CG06_land_8_20_14_3_00_39_12]